MMQYTVVFHPENTSVAVEAGTTILQAQIFAGLRPDAPCGGKGSCGKCVVFVDGEKVLACHTSVERDMAVWTQSESLPNILTESFTVKTEADGTDPYAMAFDIGTTTIVAYLLDGKSGNVLAEGSCVNPQCQYGADVISRIQYALDGNMAQLSACLRRAMEALFQSTCQKAGISAGAVTAAAIAGNTAMHHLLLGISPNSLVTPPYMPGVSEALTLDGHCRVRVLPNMAGFVGGDTVGCMVSTRFDALDELSLLIDIGTNGEMVLGSKRRRIACSTAAGPAFEGAKISCGMRGAEGAVDHVFVKNGKITYHVIGEGKALGLCGSGLLDLISVLLETGVLDASGYLEGKQYTLCENVDLTQKDVREVQLAKAAIRAGIELLAEQMGATVGDIQRVYLAGAFGNYLTPASACRIGMIPSVLEHRILPIGNAAGEGAKLCAISKKEFQYSKSLAATSEFLELAHLPQFQDRFVDALAFSEVDE